MKTIARKPLMIKKSYSFKKLKNYNSSLKTEMAVQTEANKMLLNIKILSNQYENNIIRIKQRKPTNTQQSFTIS